MNEPAPEGGLSFAERLVWHGREGASLPFFDCARNLSSVVRLRGELDRAALAASIDTVARRHHVLRSRFVTQSAGLRRLLDAAALVPLPVTDLSDVGGDADAVSSAIKAEVSAPFDLGSAPLLRARLFAVAPTDHVVALTADHIVHDGWSQRVVATDLAGAYAAHVRGAAPALPPLKVDYGDYVQWERDRVQADEGHRQVAYWVGRLHNAPDLLLGWRRARPCRPSTRAVSSRFVIAREDVDCLAAASRAAQATLASTLLALFHGFLSGLADQDDVCVGVPVSNRRRRDFESLVGLFTNVVVVRARIDPERPLGERIEAIRQAFGDACRHQDVPYGHLVGLLGRETPLYRAVFNFVPHVPSPWRLPGLAEERLSVADTPEARADISLSVHRREGTLACRLTCNADLCTVAEADRLARRLLEDVIAAAGAASGASDP